MSLPVSCPQFSRVCDVLDPGFLLIVCSEYSSSDPPSATVEQNKYSCSAVQELLDGHFVTLDENSTRNIAQLGGPKLFSHSILFHVYYINFQIRRLLPEDRETVVVVNLYVYNLLSIYWRPKGLLFKLSSHLPMY